MTLPTRLNLPIFALVAAVSANPASAESLASALATAYESNPDLQVQRAVVRQSDEGAAQALGGFRPTLGGNATLRQNGTDFKNNGRVTSFGAQITQPIYTGGQSVAALGAADNRILAARARLRASENTVMVNVVRAYANVQSFERVVELTGNQVKVLSRERQASKDRFEVGDLTRTDVAQAQARLARSQSLLIGAQGNLSAAREAYRRVVGRAPENLEPLPPLPTLPGTQGQAVDIANANNPDLIAARFSEAAARYDVRELQGQRLPSLSASAAAQYQKFDGGGSSGSFVQTGKFFTQTIALTASVPFYQAGIVGSQIRQAQERRSAALETIGATARQVIEAATNAFTTVETARATIESAKVAVEANTLALEGVKQENQVGSRTVLEVLNAEQELLTAQVDLVQATRDEYVAGYQLLASLGLAEAGALQIPVTRYDPGVNAKRVRNNWGDWSVGGNPPVLPLPDKAAASASTSDFVVGPPR